MSSDSTPAPSPLSWPRGPHWIAVCAALFTLPLLISGAQVTTNRVGMAVPDWPTTFGVNMFVYNFFEAPLGVVIEHRHRLFGSALGFASILLALWCILGDRRRWMKAVGIAAFLAVLTQGVLGGIRVLRNSTVFAAIHGSTGQAVFAFLVAICVLTSRDWASAGAGIDDAGSIRRRSLVTLLLVYAQIVVGATLRHFGANLGLHAVLALAVWGHIAALAWRVERTAALPRALVASSRFMAISASFQILLGIGAWWLLRPFDGIPREVTRIQAIFRSGHVVNGAILLGTTLAVTLRAFRHLAPAEASATEPAGTARGRAVEAVA